MEREAKTFTDLKIEGFVISKSQYDELAMLDILCECNCSVYDVLKILKILKLI